VDATDNYKSRYLINDASLITRKPIVYASIYKYQGQLSVFNYNNGPSYRCLFPSPTEQTQNCSQIGVIGVLAGILGCLQANEVIKLILGIGKPLSGKVLLFNAKTSETQLFKLSKRTPQDLSISEFSKQQASVLCQPQDELTPKQLHQILSQNQNVQFIDLREDNEQPKIHAFEKHKTSVEHLQKDLTTVLYCQSGSRSKTKLLQLKREHPYQNLFHLKGGINAWVKNYPKTKIK